LGIGTLVSAPAVDAAEEINVTYGVLGREIPVKSLVKFAETGEVDEDMSGYASYATQSRFGKVSPDPKRTG
jgi:hypothetical protein